jgi:hypothetical protein
MNSFDNVALAVCLEAVDLNIHGLASRDAQRLNVSQGLVAIQFGLPPAERI